MNSSIFRLIFSLIQLLLAVDVFASLRFFIFFKPALSAGWPCAHCFFTKKKREEKKKGRRKKKKRREKKREKRKKKGERREKKKGEEKKKGRREEKKGEREEKKGEEKKKGRVVKMDRQYQVAAMIGFRLVLLPMLRMTRDDVLNSSREGEGSRDR